MSILLVNKYVNAMPPQSNNQANFGKGEKARIFLAIKTHGKVIIVKIAWSWSTNGKNKPMEQNRVNRNVSY